MERTVPSTESEEVELYLRTYYSLLRTSAEVQIRTLEEVHAGMNSLLHPAARNPEPDMSAFLYSLLRLPDCMTSTRLVVLGQNAAVFARGGFPDLGTWEETCAQARRRRCFFNRKDTLACFIASRSDIDDVIPLLTAFQIEWNKLHQLFQRLPRSVNVEEMCASPSCYSELAEMIDIPVEEFDRLFAIWDRDFGRHIAQIAASPCRIRVRLLNGSLTEYRRATNEWWDQIERTVPELHQRPVYFVSSNTHSLVNILSGVPLQVESTLVRYLDEPGNTGLLREWEDIQSGGASSSRENFLYYVYRKFSGTPRGREMREDKVRQEVEAGIRRIPSRRSFDVDAQVMEISRLKPEGFDPRLLGRDFAFLRHSDALILNIDYPLGLAAYNLLTEVAEHVGSVLGVYVMGKAATLNGVVGDVMIPNVVHDEHSQNTYLFPNCFSAADVAPNLVYGTVLDNQKAVTVQGTFLQNARYMDVFYREGYTDIEMESGAYLSAIYEMYRPTRHPTNEIVNLYGLPFDFGLIHYSSDTPLSKGRNLGAGSLSYFGMDSTYATSLAILGRIFQLERERLPERNARKKAGSLE